MSTVRFAPQAILFDLDGTLLDTIADLVTASNLMLIDLGRPTRPQAQIHSFVGKGVANLVGRCLTEGGPPVTDAELTLALEVFCRHYTRVNGQITRPYPGVPELLAQLAARKLKMAIVTNKATAFTLPLLEQFELAHYFSAVVCGDTLPIRKPDPAVIDHTCARLGVKPAEALMIGDSANDALAARGAGAPVLLVSYGYSEGMAVDSIECDGLLSNALQVLDYLA
ncbi:phosphoglycolate phosphatase, bacterial [Betaproteobacteria bacterium]|nr:phosphoglycolate phosphatase, bacterial [Betaproteobacteria bacterium]GHU23229.1 phosphoglycolate phosphatase, bacterial [Betaproteobacteria bacterium]GHU28089.1 phosphoglycolate phosphatase, bacterial [Betaproteobacteria bacterium]